MNTNNKSLERQDKLVAYHEAGHAIMFWDLLHTSSQLTMLRQGEQLGLCIPDELKTVRERIANSADHFLDSETAVRLEVEKEVMILLAGKVAEHRLKGIPRMPNICNIAGALDDFIYVEKWICTIMPTGSDECYYFQKWLWYRTWNLLNLPLLWIPTIALANELLTRRELTSQQVKEIITESMPKTCEPDYKDNMLSKAANWKVV